MESREVINKCRGGLLEKKIVTWRMKFHKPAQLLWFNRICFNFHMITNCIKGNYRFEVVKCSLIKYLKNMRKEIFAMILYFREEKTFPYATTTHPKCLIYKKITTRMILKNRTWERCLGDFLEHKHASTKLLQ